MTPWTEPFEKFAAWFEEAKAATLVDPNAMQLATVDAAGRPSVRTVLLKDFDARGFTFYSNHGSRKGRELDAAKVAALNFYWPALGRQVRVEGQVAEVTAQEADAYFATRPRLSQLGAWASLQSEVLASREALEARVEAFEQRFAGQPVPRPPHWGGWRLAPDRLEFWRAHPNRLHWRELYEREGAGWRTCLLYP
jgi:pyridoxamine 5'-phosphate oxidase